MLRGILGRLTYANLMATVAVFIAIGGGAYAAGMAKNTVKSKHIKDAEVKAVDLAPNAVTTGTVADGTLLGRDFAAGALPAGEQGPAGPAGPPGATGATGATGQAGKDGDDGEDGEDGLDGQDGVDGVDGDDGSDGADGSPDTAAQVLAKLLGVDGAGSGLNADQVDGVEASGLGDVMSSRLTVPQGAVTNTFAATTGISTAGTPRSSMETGSPNRTVVARDLFVRLTQAAAGTVTVRLVVDGTATSLTCTVSGTVCDSAGASVQIPAGSSIALGVVEGAGAEAQAVSAMVGFRLAPA